VDNRASPLEGGLRGVHVPTPVGERVAQLAGLIQDGVAAQVDRVKVEQLEQRQQPAGADLGDVHA